MQSYRYEALDASGRAVRGTLHAPDEVGALRQIQQMGLRAQRISGRPDEEMRWYQRWARGYLSFLIHPVKSKDRAIWFRQFSYLLRAGMNLYEAADSVASKSRNRTLRQVASEIARAAEQGEPPLTVVRRWPCAFPPFVQSIMAIGHETGVMDETFKRLADFYDKVFALENLWRMETFYLKALIVAIIVIAPVPILVKPWIGEMGGGLLPYLRAVGTGVLSVGGPIVSLLLGWRALRLLPGFAEAVDSIKLALPWFGKTVRRTAVSRWARAMAMMFEAGVPITRAVREGSGAAGNAAIERSVARHVGMLDAGQPLSAVLQASGHIPEQVIDMVVTGERSGNVAGMLDTAAEYYELETDTAHKQTVITTVMVVFLCVAAVIGYMYLRTAMSYTAGIQALTNQ